MTRLLITGGTGFVGAALIERAKVDSCFEICASVRTGQQVSGVRTYQVPDLSATTSWTAALDGVEVVIHTAARVHIMHDASSDPLREFREINVEGTLNLARQAAAAGVRRFIFISSVKVNGESTEPGYAFKPDDKPNPHDPYGISKMEAEAALLPLGEQGQMDVVIIRPVLVYGPGVKGNFLSMMRWLNRGVPLPLGAIKNMRSLVGIDNLVDLIVICIDHPLAANQIFLVSDREDLSTTQLLTKLSIALHKPSRLVPIPSYLIGHVAKLVGRNDIFKRLCGSLQVDTSKTHELLGWTPKVSVDQGLRDTVSNFLNQGK